MTPVARLVRSIDRSDRDILIAWTSARRPVTLRLMRAITHLGDAAVVIAIVTLGFALGSEIIARAAAVAAFTLVVSHGFVQLLKRTVGRPRPDLPPGASLIEAPDRFSFPSGHSAAALSIALPAAGVLAPPLAAAALALGLLVGLSRCYLGVHYPGDVAVGWLLAVVAWLIAPAALALL